MSKSLPWFSWFNDDDEYLTVDDWLWWWSKWFSWSFLGDIDSVLICDEFGEPIPDDDDGGENNFGDIDRIIGPFILNGDFFLSKKALGIFLEKRIIFINQNIMFRLIWCHLNVINRRNTACCIEMSTCLMSDLWMKWTVQKLAEFIDPVGHTFIYSTTKHTK